jgi:hypothetical protein
MTRIEKRFEKLKAEKRQAFIPYVTAGDPTCEITGELILGLEEAGADIIELGVPRKFADSLRFRWYCSATTIPFFDTALKIWRAMPPNAELTASWQRT